MFQLKERPELKIKPEDVNADLRPQLSTMLYLTGGEAWLLSEESLGTDPEHTRLLILLASAGQFVLIEDTLMPGSEEAYRQTSLSEEAMESLSALMAPLFPQQRVPAGRPPKYSLANEGTEIFIRHLYENMSIKKLAREYQMSPTTVQKLLNQARSRAARQMLSGEWPLTAGTAHYQQDISVLAWAASHLDKDEQAACRQLLLEHHYEA